MYLIRKTTSFAVDKVFPPKHQKHRKHSLLSGRCPSGRHRTAAWLQGVLLEGVATPAAGNKGLRHSGMGQNSALVPRHVRSGCCDTDGGRCGI